MYEYDYKNEDVLDGMKYVVNKFIRDNVSCGVNPVILFIPANTLDLSSPDALISELKLHYPNAIFLNFGQELVRGGEYVAGEGCHPTISGYKNIAAYVGRAIVESKLLH